MAQQDELASMPTRTLQDLVDPHVESFNFFLDKGLHRAVNDLAHIIHDAEDDMPALEYWIDKASIGKPQLRKNEKATPRDCRELGVSYEAPLTVTLAVKRGNEAPYEVTKEVGNIPIMVRSNHCYLAGLNQEELVQAKEEPQEVGGYFILNGNERIVRLLIQQKRNMMIGIIRNSYVNRGPRYTKYAVSLRCGRADLSTETITLYYLKTGTCMLGFRINKAEYYLPAGYALKAFKQCTDKHIFHSLVQHDDTSNFMRDRAEATLRLAQDNGMYNQAAVLNHIGNAFRAVTINEPSQTHADIAKQVLKEHVFVHCNTMTEKFDCLVLMIRKLWDMANGKSHNDNPDAADTHEVLLPGHLMTVLVKDQLDAWLKNVRSNVQRQKRRAPHDLIIGEKFRPTMDKLVERTINIGDKVSYFFKTGNLISRTGLDINQQTGFVVTADKLNFFRWLSHFRGVHRGQFFTTMKTTTVRKLLPESWGFMCPVHTPDGTPCGLLNHLAMNCDLVPDFLSNYERSDLLAVLAGMGMVKQEHTYSLPYSYVPIVLDGIPVGKVSKGQAHELVALLRNRKVDSDFKAVPELLEIASFLNPADKTFISINLYTAPARFIRPVIKLGTPENPVEKLEYIGASEQVQLEIACTIADFRKGETTHVELDPSVMLSLLASLTPFSDFNQSPRNMYQCQMGKQTMGTPGVSLQHRADNKIYRIQTPQKPLVRCANQTLFPMDEYPLGTNAVVAVISYTGYDMEDAMILSKSSYERGFAHGSVYKHKEVDLSEFEGNNTFNNTAPEDGKDVLEEHKKHGVENDQLDLDGLQRVGQYMVRADESTAKELHQPLYAYGKPDDRAKVKMFQEAEPMYVDTVRIADKHNSKTGVNNINMKLRLNRNPVIGDKFASRHGQKGVLSVLWPQEDMPFSESGMSPDIIINPHAFPSRMTIGMLIESMAGKSASLHGKWQDSSPFQFSEDNLAIDHFGEQLAAAGYNYYGTETLYSGLTGVEMKAEIFIGIVHYQRLRHMVKDKFQVRSTGPVNSIHRQPVKGRKKGGGIRFGEMERDSLLAHGCSFLLHDRLMGSSDYHTTHVCTSCGSLLNVVSNKYGDFSDDTKTNWAYCKMCKTGETCSEVAVPYVFLYLVNELAAMNIRTTLDVK